MSVSFFWNDFCTQSAFQQKAYSKRALKTYLGNSGSCAEGLPFNCKTAQIQSINDLVAVA